MKKFFAVLLLSISMLISQASYIGAEENQEEVKLPENIDTEEVSDLEIETELEDSIEINTDEVVEEEETTLPEEDPSEEATETIQDIFPDPYFADFVANYLNKEISDEVTQDELNTVTAIVIDDVPLKSIEGIQRLQGLIMNLRITNTDLEDMSPLDLKYYSKVQSIILSNNNIHDISFFNTRSEIMQLMAINLESNYIEDVSPLKDIPTGRLYMRDNYVSDITPIIESNVGYDTVDFTDNLITHINLKNPTLRTSDLILTLNRISEIEYDEDAISNIKNIVMDKQILFNEIIEMDTEDTELHLRNNLKGLYGEEMVLTSEDGIVEDQLIHFYDLSPKTEYVAYEYGVDYQLDNTRSTKITYSGVVLIPLQYPEEETDTPKEEENTDKPKEETPEKEETAKPEEKVEAAVPVSEGKLPNTGISTTNTSLYSTLMIGLGSLALLLRKKAK